MCSRALFLTSLAAAVLLAACSEMLGPPLPGPRAAPQTVPPSAPGVQPGAPAQPVPPPVAPPTARHFRLGPAAMALVAQAHAQADQQHFAPAAATIERALRIEPENPLLWIELGRVRLSEGNALQADGMARKALALATGDPQAQAAAQRLIADSKRIRS